jgi:hypothetical protein
MEPEASHQRSCVGERFFSKIIDGVREFLKTFMYVTENPARARLVGRIDGWEYGGLGHFKIGEEDILYQRIIASL